MFPPFSEPDPDSESRPPSPYGERDPRQPQNNLYTVTDKRPDHWTGFKTRFLKNWEEIDSSGNVYLVIEGPVWSGFFPNMGKP